MEVELARAEEIRDLNSEILVVTADGCYDELPEPISISADTAGGRAEDTFAGIGEVVIGEQLRFAASNGRVPQLRRGGGWYMWIRRNSSQRSSSSRR